MARKCVSCKYFVPAEYFTSTVSLGECHRFAPRMVEELKSTAGSWPGVLGTDWCGEFSRKMENSNDPIPNKS